MSVRAAAAALLLLLTACASVPLAPRAPEPFDLLGRALVNYSGGALTSNVRWEHSATRDEIWLMTPMGQTLAHIVDTGDGVVLTRADRQQHRADSVEALTRQALGWPLPVNLLQYWVRGMPAPGMPVAAARRDAQGRLVAFTQSHWQVKLTYAGEGEYAGRVRRVDFADGPHSVRFVIDTWREASGA